MSKQNREQNPESEVDIHKTGQTGISGRENAGKNCLHTLQSGRVLAKDQGLNNTEKEE